MKMIIDKKNQYSKKLKTTEKLLKNVEYTARVKQIYLREAGTGIGNKDELKFDYLNFNLTSLRSKNWTRKTRIIPRPAIP